jgi:hypothetical protein
MNLLEMLLNCNFFAIVSNNHINSRNLLIGVPLIIHILKGSLWIQMDFQVYAGSIHFVVLEANEKRARGPMVGRHVSLIWLAYI